MATTLIPPVISTVLNSAGGSNGIAGTTMTISGSAFKGGGTRSNGTTASGRTRVFVGGILAADSGVAAFSLTDTTIIIPCPSGLSPGVYDVTVSTTAAIGVTSGGTNETFNSGTSTKTAAWTINAPPTISAVSPSSGTVGIRVTVTGTGFAGANAVRLSGFSTTGLIVASSTSLSFLVPNLPVNQFYNLSIFTSFAGSVTLGSAFFINPPPTITSITPNAIIQLTSENISIVGSGFTAPVTVSVGGVACTNVVVVSPTNVTCDPPAAAAGTYSVVVTTGANGTVTAVNGIRYVFPISLFGAGFAVEFPEAPALPLIAEGATGIQVIVSKLNTTAEANFQTPPGKSVSTYNASGAGRSYTKNHHHQIYDGTDTIEQSRRTQHDPTSGESLFSLLGMRGLITASKTIAISEPVGTAQVVEIASHGGKFYTGFHLLQNPLDGNGESITGDMGVASLRLAFDDTKVYGLITFEAALPNKTNSYSATYKPFLFEADSPSLPVVEAMDLISTASMSHSIGDDLYLQLLDCLTKAHDLYTAEHDLRTGEHKIPLGRLSGFATAYSGMINVPSGVGGVLPLRIEGLFQNKQYFTPSLVGSPGSGIVTASLGWDGDDVLLLVRRITPGSSNVFQAKVYSVNDV